MDKSVFSFAAIPAVLLSTSSCESAAPEWQTGAMEQSRQFMIERQLKDRGIADPRVLKAMMEVPRHELVPEELSDRAYEDRPLPIGHGQTISQPYIVAFMTEQLAPKADDRVLEVGTGSGYQAAVFGKLVKDVYTIEIVKPLATRAKEDLARLGFENVHVKAGDGYLGWPEHAPFDSVIVTCAPDHIPKPLVEQLAEGGTMIIPVGEDGGVQELYLLRKKNGSVQRESVLPVRFVPMTGRAKE